MSELKSRLQTAHQQAHQSLIKSKKKSKEYYVQAAKQSKFKIGDKVLLFDEMVRCRRLYKLSAQWIGPYTITGLDEVNATIARGRKLVTVHINRLKPFY